MTTLLSPEEQEALLAHCADLEARLEALQARVEFAEAERRVALSQPRYVAPEAREDYKGPRGMMGQPIMSKEAAWAHFAEEAGDLDAKRKAAGICSLAYARECARRERGESKPSTPETPAASKYKPVSR